jgi:sulfoacetaldehyde acetyltransferase
MPASPRPAGCKGVVARTMDELTEGAEQGHRGPDAHGKTTLIEAMINQELGEPFRRDAMKKPVAVAGIDPADMRPQDKRRTDGGQLAASVRFGAVRACPR